MDLYKNKTPRDTGPSKRWTQMDLEPAKREDTELLKERTQRNTGFSVGSTWVRSEGENGRLTTLSSRTRRLVRHNCWTDTSVPFAYKLLIAFGNVKPRIRI